MPSRASTPTTVGRIAPLDGLRGIAILSVIAMHWLVEPARPALSAVGPWLYPTLAQVAHGVDVFFVVSGFLIGRILLTAGASPGFLKVFYVRRFLRIVPVYFAVLVTLVLLRAATHGYPESAIPVWSYFAFVNNVFMTLGQLPEREFGPYWSLAIEEQFYLLGALAVALRGRQSVIVLACCFIFGSVAVRALAFYGLVDLQAWWPATLGHSDPIGIGLLTAAVLVDSRGAALVQRHAAAIRLAARGALACFLAVSPFKIVELLGLDIPLVSLATAFWIASVAGGTETRMLSGAALRRCGEMCFSLYILHEAFRHHVSLALFAAGLSAVPTLLVTFGLLVLVCLALWRWVEQPLIRYGRRRPYHAGIAVPPLGAVRPPGSFEDRCSPIATSNL